MPTEKRQRKKQGREARLAEIRAQEAKARLRKRIIGAAVVAVAIVAAALVFSRGGDDTKVAAKGTTTTAAGDASTTTTAATATSKASSTTTPTGSAACPPAEGTAAPKKQFPTAPPVCIDAKKAYSAEVKTDVGAFTVDLDAAKAPKTVNNFVFLARNHYYDGVPFHRVIPGFVVQGGDGEKGDGTGGPGYEFADELPKAGSYKVGSLAMANSGPNTNGSQFFVITGDQGVGLPPSYSLFGQVSSGLTVVKAIEADGAADGTPKVTHKITKVTVTEKAA